MDNSITLKSINDLLAENFIIPSYQRGYRWTESQIIDLLNDILEFNNKDKSRDEFCSDLDFVDKKLRCIFVKKGIYPWKRKESDVHLTRISRYLQSRW